ncbi:cytochrome c oxidase assembly factor 1 [[Candida] jaroonii]|uniref:Cytochrome c oxidase assembly factor 1 n=1 Tax=[Candida] jaroonii TaxID=467808 RepID=A0ACA9Y983_9ASCO|nr:cytochrome c oxidase assembly factor 1 [[Candida] jaroonii]
MMSRFGKVLGPRLSTLITSSKQLPSPATLALRYNSTANHVGKLDNTFKGQQISIDRELPDPFKFKKTNRKYFFAYGIGVIVSCVVIFNYEKTTSPILNSVFYFLRRNPSVLDKLGENISYKYSWPWISGELNTVKGEIDISFDIKGDKNAGKLHFKASRSSKLVPFTIHHWFLEVDGQKIDLKENDKIDFGF